MMRGRVSHWSSTIHTIRELSQIGAHLDMTLCVVSTQNRIKEVAFLVGLH